VRPLQPIRDEDLAAIGDICRLVEGMPLAIELAAAWSSTLSIDNIAREIGESIDFLEIPLRDLPARHRSMRAVFDQSWELLSPDEQSVFQRLSMFRAGISREAAEHVAGATLPILSTLVSKSFLRTDATGRYTIHELLRQYGETRLASAHREELRTKDRYGKYFLGIVAEREDALTGRFQKEALAEILAEIANIRHAWHVALKMHMKESINQAMHGVWLFYALRGWMREGEATFGEAVIHLSPADDEVEAGVTPDIVLAKALTRQGGFQSGLGHYETAIALLRVGITMLRRLDARNELALALNFMAAATHMGGTQEEEQALLEESLALFQEVGDRWGEAYVLNDVARLMHARGDGARADELVLESQRLFRHVNDVRGLAFAAQNLGILAADRDDIPAARQCHEQALALRRESEDQWGIASSLVHLGIVTRSAGDLDTAQTLLMEALRVAREAWVLPVVLEGFVELAAVLAAKGQTIQAGEMLATVLHDSAASHQIRERSEELLEELEHDMADIDRIELHERAASTTVDMLAKSVLS
jgi:tetratricopeptide (TPR) repeat protein